MSAAPRSEEEPPLQHGQGDQGDARVFFLKYLGKIVLDWRYTQRMLPWILVEVKRRNEEIPVTVTVQAQTSQTLMVKSAENGQVIYTHSLHKLSRFTTATWNSLCFGYLTREDVDKSPFTCRVFQASTPVEVSELHSAIVSATQESPTQLKAAVMPSREGSTESLGLEIENMGSQLYEVMYIGKISVSSSKTEPSFIDEAVGKFAEYELRKNSLQKSVNVVDSGNRLSNSTDSVRRLSRDTTPLANSTSLEAINTSSESSYSFVSSSSSSGAYSEGDISGLSGFSGDMSFERKSSVDRGDNRRRNNVSLSYESLGEDNDGNTPGSGTFKLSPSLNATTPVQGNSTSSTRSVSAGKNRTMLIGVGKASLTLISLDRKSVIMERDFKHISFCAQGVEETKHFGFISREPSGSAHQFLCYVFQCASQPVVEEVMNTLKNAFHSAFQENAKNHVVCELCPMHQLHKLCQQIEGLSPEKAFPVLQRRINALGDRDNNDIMSKLKNEGAKNIQGQVEAMVSKLRQMCEEKQREHLHISDNNRTDPRTAEFTLVESNRSKFNLRKAKKSLASSFENLLRVGRSKKEENGRDRSAVFDSDSNLSRSYESSGGSYSARTSPDSRRSPLEFTAAPQQPTRGEGFYRPRSSTTGSLPDTSVRHIRHEDILSPSNITQSPLRETPRRNIFARLNTNHSSSGSSSSSTTVSSPSTPGTPESLDEAGVVQACRNMGRRQSFRMGILTRVVTPAKGVRYLEEESEELPDRKLSSQSCRALWRKAILETLLLIRMEKENITLQAHQDAVEIRRQKLDYEEITPCLIEVTKVWDAMLNTPGRGNVQFPDKQLHSCVKAGVPRSRRGDIWQLLVEQHQLSSEKHGRNNNVNESIVPYEDLLKQLTTHQHAILIDLGRTFPNHPYFSRQLGPGQLSLFNLLKAYSLIDKEVGYCQGLSFVAGVLLMHMKESAAFTTLKYLMFNLGFRRQYRPDMSALQIKMYQLSRLLHDYYQDLYSHLERHEIVPTFYAAPWFLTLFASQFPLGFVARVFDLIFLQGTEVVYKVALVLLGNHKELIMQCNSFETIVEFLKTTLPEMGIIQMERIINQVFTLDITQQLKAYEVEYHVLQEEMSYNASQQDAGQLVRKLENANSGLKHQNLQLLEQLQIANTRAQSLEVQLQNMISRESKLKSHVRTLELERTALLNAVSKLRKLLTDDVIDLDDLSRLSAAGSDIAGASSPLLYPAVDRILQEEVILGATSANSSNSSLNSVGGKIVESMSSLNGFDTEVATLTRSCNQSPVTFTNTESNRPSSATC